MQINPGMSLALTVASALMPVAASAQETTTYIYDAKGRLITATRSGGPSSGATTVYTYDSADSRTNVTVTNSPNGNGIDGTGGVSAPTVSFVVVPLNGLSLLMIRK